MAHIRVAFAESGKTYSAPRVLHELREAGLPTSTKRVARLMRAEGLVARPRKRQRVVTRTEPSTRRMAGLQAVGKATVKDIFRHIETWSNRKRQHSTRSYVSPVV